MQYSALVVFLLAGNLAFAKEPPKKTASKATDIPKVVFLGDSITAGYGVEKDQAFPALMEKAFEKDDLPFEAINAGISGSTSASGPSRLRWLLRSNPDVVVLELGANDALRGQQVKMTKENLRKTIKLATDKKVRVMLIGMQIPKNYGKEYITQFAQLYGELAKEENVYFVPFIEEFLGDKKLVQSDAIHPNPAGHKLIAKELQSHLKNVLIEWKNGKKK